jgi:hypothetical protein
MYNADIAPMIEYIAKGVGYHAPSIRQVQAIITRSFMKHCRHCIGVPHEFFTLPEESGGLGLKDLDSATRAAATKKILDALNHRHPMLSIVAKSTFVYACQLQANPLSRWQNKYINTGIETRRRHLPNIWNNFIDGLKDDDWDVAVAGLAVNVDATNIEWLCAYLELDVDPDIKSAITTLKRAALFKVRDILTLADCTTDTLGRTIIPQWIGYRYVKQSPPAAEIDMSIMDGPRKTPARLKATELVLHKIMDRLIHTDAGDAFISE